MPSAKAKTKTKPKAAVKSKPKVKAKVKAQAKTGKRAANLKDLVMKRDYWLKLAPDFHIEGKFKPQPFPLSAAQKKQIKAKIVKEGYGHLYDPGLAVDFPRIAKLFDKIAETGLPPVFAFVYDELWAISGGLHNLLSSVLHEDYAGLPDFWAWRVKPGQSGWKPHRDKGPDCLFPDRTPKSLTVWVPITEAHPLNGCMSILPADRDQFYGRMVTEDYFPGQIPDIRALPAKAGDVLFWTQHAFHWGGRSADEHHLPPRMSVAFEFQRTDVQIYNKPLLNPAKALTFEERLALIGKQVMQYRHMYGYLPDLVAIAENMIMRTGLPRSVA